METLLMKKMTEFTANVSQGDPTPNALHVSSVATTQTNAVSPFYLCQVCKPAIAGTDCFNIEPSEVNNWDNLGII